MNQRVDDSKPCFPHQTSSKDKPDQISNGKMITKGKKKYYIQMPRKVAEILPAWEENPPFKGFQFDNLRRILSIISTHLRKDEKGNIYAQLVMKYLRNITWNAEKYIQLLIKSDIIVRIGGYTPGDHAYKYRFTSAFQSPYITTELNNAKLIRKINKENALSGRKSSRRYPHQNRQIQSMILNFEKAIKLSHEKFPSDDQVNKLNYAIGAVTRIQNKEFYHRVDDTGNRLHTNLTNLPRFLRSEIQINQKYISGVDIRNSQPYIATKFLSNPESTKEFFPGKFPLMMLKCLRLPEQEDVKKFLLLTSKAQFYKYLETEFNKKGLHYEIISHDKVSQELKDKIFQILFDKNHHTSMEKRIFNELFPGVEKAFSVLRMDDYKNFVISLQRMESHIVLDIILRRLNTEHSELVATQIYDSVCTSIATDDIKTVCQVMKEELTKFIGLPPVLKVEKF